MGRIHLQQDCTRDCPFHLQHPPLSFADMAVGLGKVTEFHRTVWHETFPLKKNDGLGPISASSRDARGYRRCSYNAAHEPLGTGAHVIGTVHTQS